MVQMLKVEAVEVEDRSYTVRFLEVRTPRGQKRYSAEIVLGAHDHIILDDDSLLSLEARARRVAPATIYSRMLARATAA
jgi:hypothetical protein